MVRHVIAASGALVLLAAIALAPRAAAQGDQTVLIESGTVRCLVSANLVAGGGGEMVLCQKVTGEPWAQSPFSAEKYSERLNLAVIRASGQFYWDGGNLRTGPGISGPIEPVGQDIVVDDGQTYRGNGWTIQAEDQRTRVSNDRTGHGMLVAEQQIIMF